MDGRTHGRTFLPGLLGHLSGGDLIRTFQNLKVEIPKKYKTYFSTISGKK